MAELSINSPHLPEGYEFHHLGFATASIEKEKSQFATLGFYQKGEAFIDPIQGVIGCFLEGPGPRIELLENLPGSHTLTPWLNAGIRIYHFAYLVDRLDAALAWTSTVRAKLTVPPVSAVAFQKRKICFAMLRNQLMIEFVEKPSLDGEREGI